MTNKVVRNNIEAFAERFLELEKQKELLKEDTKALREEFNQEGVPTAIVIRCINEIKKLKKKTASEMEEQEAIQEWLLGNEGISSTISALVSK